jgi:glutathione reductase (NADPH)
MPAPNYDVLIIGGGNAGLGVTVPARKAGLSVALIEEAELGGVCPNRGCTPKKVLVAAAHALDEIERAAAHGIKVGRPQLDWAALIDREKGMIAHIPQSVAHSLQKRGVEVLHGRAAFAGPNRVRVGEATVEARHIVIASGSKPRSLPIDGAGHMITSDEVLSERVLPRAVVFVGGGVIALEFSHVYARAGAQVTVLEALPRLLGQMDEDAVARLRAESERIGISVKTGVKLKRVEKTADRLRVVYEDGGKEAAIEADRVVNGAGRIPNVDHLDLDAGKVENDKGRIALQPHLQSKSNPAVWVAGDPLASPQLSPLASYEGDLVGRNIAEGARHAPDYAAIPSCVYTVPALASVGLTEAAAREKGLNVRVVTTDMADWLLAKTYAETVAWAKVLIEEGSDRIAGAHMVGHAGEEVINVFALAMAHGIKAGALRDMIYAFPTFTNSIKHLL